MEKITISRYHGASSETNSFYFSVIVRTQAENPTDILTVSKEAADELNQIAKDCLDKAGLIELSGKLKALES